ncbi:MAG: hypothetical protein HOQ22_06745 [Nocardioidaceae bacterium]|nr:hypothetical protein [Nocardioidaceae bacterium]NUS50727.1 hypothetical protein [Nocardioidaceae bacterium]
MALLVIGGAALFSLRSGVGPLPDPEGCRATVGGRAVSLDTEQAENASLIAALGTKRGLPARAASIALATAYQESKLRNLDHGDRDSLGLFQQRPSQGWGSAEQIQNPWYSINRFYDELQKIHGYQTMRITEAAQKVQRSGFPEAYEDHAPDGRALASALTGYSPAKFTCVVHSADNDVARQRPRENGLTPRANRVRRNVERAFGDLPLGGFAPGGVSTGHQKGSAHYDGRAIDIFVRPISPDNKRRGWAIASYLMAHASELRIDHLIFDGRIWSAGLRSEQGWRRYDPGDGPGDRAVLLHRDHVHVDVAEGD